MVSRCRHKGRGIIVEVVVVVVGGGMRDIKQVEVEVTIVSRRSSRVTTTITVEEEVVAEVDTIEIKEVANGLLWLVMLRGQQMRWNSVVEAMMLVVVQQEEEMLDMIGDKDYRARLRQGGEGLDCLVGQGHLDTDCGWKR